MPPETTIEEAPLPSTTTTTTTIVDTVPESTIEETTTTIEETTTTIGEPAALTSADVDAFLYLGAGGFFLVIMLLVAIFVRSGS